VATPVASVDTEALTVPPVKLPLAPVAGAVNTTIAPETPLPPLSFTVAFNAANTALMATLCGVPEVAVMLAGADARLVRENAADEATPVTVAFTV